MPQEHRDKFLTTSDNSLDFGEIDQEQANAISINPAPIRFEKQSYKHLTPKRVKEIQEAGYETPEAMAEDVAKNKNAIYQGKDNTLLLAKRNGKSKISYVELIPAENDNYYRVNTLIVARKDFLKNKKPLWERAQTNQQAGSLSSSAISSQSDNVNISQKEQKSSDKLREKSTNNPFSQNETVSVYGEPAIIEEVLPQDESEKKSGEFLYKVRSEKSGEVSTFYNTSI